MAPSERADDERRIEELVRVLAAEGADAGLCLDPNELARLAAGLPMPEERARLERHLARCDACQTVAALLLRTPATQLRPVRPPLASRGARVALAAAAGLLAVTGIALLLHWQTTVASHEPADPEARLARVVAELTRSVPELAGFHPLSRAERLQPTRKTERGGFALLGPAGTVLDPRPAFRWEGQEGVLRWRVTLLSVGGAAAWSEIATGNGMSWPAAQAPLADGETYLWEVAGEGPLGHEESRGSFTVANAPERAAFAAATAAILRQAPTDLHQVLVAHLALRRNFLGAAETALRARLREEPADELARESLFAVLNALGASEAETLGVASRPGPGPASRR